MGKMRRCFVFGVWVLLLFVALFGAVLNVPVVRASGTIYIKADGSIDPPTAPILTADDLTYTFIDDINDSVVVERSSIVIDGCGRILQGAGTEHSIGIDLTKTTNVTIRNIQIRGWWHGIWLNRSSNESVYGNYVTSNMYGIQAVNSSNNRLATNSITENGEGIYFESDSNWNIMFDNNITANNGNGVYLSGCWNNLFLENNLTDNHIGIYLIGSSNNNLIGNTITNCTINGLRLDGSHNNTVEANNIRNNNSPTFEQASGIWLHGSFNTIRKNNISNNDDGITLFWSQNNTVSQNNVSDNLHKGIKLRDSSDNKIFHNDFDNDANNVFDYSWLYSDPPSINVWDDDYPSGGNYWSDYSGVDLCTGSYQNLTEGIGSDGIGDTNYAIDGNNVDRYPLTVPWINQTPIHPLEGQYANYTVLSVNPADGSILDSLHWNLTYHKYVSPFLIYVESWNSDSSGTDWTALNITDRYARHFSWPITGILADLWFPGLIETDITIGSTVNLLNSTATVVNSGILRIESRSIECWELTHDEEIGPSTYIHHTFWFHKTTGLMIGEEAEAGSVKVNITLAESNILPDYEIVAAYGSTPTGDGKINVHEWSDATSLSFNNTTVFVKQDGTNLYVGFNNSDDQFHDDDTVLIQFDVEYDGGLILQPDDIGMLVYRNGTLLEAYVTGGTWALKEVSGWTAVVNSTFDVWQVEFSITYSKVNVVAGVEKTIGVVFARYRGLEGSSPEVFSWPPSYTEIYANPSTWGAITSTGYNWIPEFPSLPILLLLMIATLLTVIVHRKRGIKNRKTNSDDAT